MKRLRSRSAASAIALLVVGAFTFSSNTAFATMAAQSQADIGQTGDGNHTLIEQIGVSHTNNQAFVTITGNRNGVGTISGRTVTDMHGCATAGCAYGSGHEEDGTEDAEGGHDSHGNGLGLGHGTAADDFVMPEFRSGLIRQQGDDNLASVQIEGHGEDIPGDDNDFYIAQIGFTNTALQAIAGTANSAVITQGGAESESNNFSFQVQAGMGNLAYAAQNGSGNLAKQVQAGESSTLAALALASSVAVSPEALIGAARGMDAGSGNVSLLEQNGDGNEALLIQSGSNNLIALRQPGGAYASIVQVGSGHQIRVEQTAGANGITALEIVQTGSRGR